MKNEISSPYDRGAELLKFAMDEMHAQGVPRSEVAPLLADFSMWTALRLSGTPGGEAILERMRLEVTQWTMGTHGMQKVMRENGEDVPSTERLFPDPEFDLSPLRIAMEHFLSHQRMTLEYAAALFAVYAVGLVHQRLGHDRAKVIINTAKHELKRLEAEQNDDE